LLLIRSKSVIVMSFPNAIKFFHCLDVCTIIQDVIMPQMVVAVASDAIQDVIMPQIAVPAASHTIQEVIMTQFEVSLLMPHALSLSKFAFAFAKYPPPCSRRFLDSKISTTLVSRAKKCARLIPGRSTKKVKALVANG